jgi:hypothetical protein
MSLLTYHPPNSSQNLRVAEGGFFGGVGVLHRQVKGFGVNVFQIQKPGLLRFRKGRLEVHKLLQVIVVQRVGFAQAATGVELVVPDLLRRLALLKKQHHRLHPRPNEGAAGAVEHRVQVTARQQLSPNGAGGIVRVRQKGVFDHHRRSAPLPQHLDEVLQKQERRFPRFDREVLLHLLPLFAPKRRIRQDHIKAVLVLHVAEVFRQGVGVDDVRRIDAMQNQVHDADDIGQALFLFAGKGAGLQVFELLGGELAPAQVLVALAQKPRRAAGPVVNGLPQLGPHHLNHGANQRTGRVILAAVAPGVAHVFDFGLIQVREFVLLFLGAKPQLVDVLQGIPQAVATLKLVLDLAKNLANLVFDGVGAAGPLLEALQVGKQLAVDVVDQVVADQALSWSSSPLGRFGAAQLDQR